MNALFKRPLAHVRQDFIEHRLEEVGPWGVRRLKEMIDRQRASDELAKSSLRWEAVRKNARFLEAVERDAARTLWDCCDPHSSLPITDEELFLIGRPEVDLASIDFLSKEHEHRFLPIPTIVEAFLRAWHALPDMRVYYTGDCVAVAREYNGTVQAFEYDIRCDVPSDRALIRPLSAATVAAALLQTFQQRKPNARRASNKLCDLLEPLILPAYNKAAEDFDCAVAVSLDGSKIVKDCSKIVLVNPDGFIKILEAWPRDPDVKIVRSETFHRRDESLSMQSLEEAYLQIERDGFRSQVFLAPQDGERVLVTPYALCPRSIHEQANSWRHCFCAGSSVRQLIAGNTETTCPRTLNKELTLLLKHIGLYVERYANQTKDLREKGLASRLERSIVDFLIARDREFVMPYDGSVGIGEVELGTELKQAFQWIQFRFSSDHPSVRPKLVRSLLKELLFGAYEYFRRIKVKIKNEDHEALVPVQASYQKLCDDLDAFRHAVIDAGRKSDEQPS